MKPRSVVAIGGLAAVGAALIFGFLQLGTPAINRARTLDTDLVATIEQVSDTVPAVHAPRTLPPPPQFVATQSWHQIAYRRTRSGYELCADFLTSDLEPDPPNSDWFEHPAGPYCFHFAPRDLRPDDRYAISAPALARRRSAAAATARTPWERTR